MRHLGAYGDDWGTDETTTTAELPGAMLAKPPQTLSSTADQFFSGAIVGLGSFFKKIKAAVVPTSAAPGVPVVTAQASFFEQTVFGLPLPVVILAAGAGVYFLKKKKRRR